MRSISIDMWLQPRPGFVLFGRACERSHDMVRLIARAVNLTALITTLLFVLVPPESRAQGSSNCGNVLSAAQNCGMCGVVCAPGLTCSDGVCSGTSKTSNLSAFVNAGASNGASSASNVVSNAASGAASSAGNAASNAARSAGNAASNAVNNAASTAASTAVNNAVNNAGNAASNSAGSAASNSASSTATPTCNALQTLCDGRCVNTAFAPRNCGACGVVCEAGQKCAKGVCGGPGNANANAIASNNATTTCYAPQTLCGGRCVNTAFAPRNCGACGVVCEAGQKCAQGVCGGPGNANANAIASNNATTCNAPQTLCGGRCVNTAIAPRNCGACGVVCEAGQKCAQGVCGGASNANANAATTTCNAPKTLCGGRCVNTEFAPRNCGACGVVCEAGQKCAKGVCGGASNASVSCNAPKTLCGGRCVNTAIAPRNCGACGVVCTGGQVCRAGACSSP